MLTDVQAKTTRFMAEYLTAKRVMEEAYKRGTVLNLEQAHAVWAEYSDDRCAQWLVLDSENPVAEIWRAITRWKARRNYNA